MWPWSAPCAVRLRAAEPVSVRGVLLVQELLSDGYGSPLYNRERAADLRPALEECLSALEPEEKDGALMFDLAALAIAAACFAFVFVLLYVLGRV